MSGHSMRQLVWLAVAAAMGWAWSMPAPAAEGLEELVVTARKREESLQDVPLSVTAFGERELRARGLTSDFDVANFTVNFNTVQQVGRELDRPVIRGMAAPSTRGEPNASYFIDGVYVSGSVSTSTLEVVERVEILRGPQSAQFGRATFSGAVNYVTRQPSDEWEAELNSRAGTSDDYKVGLWASGPLVSDRLLLLVSGNFENYGGQWHNELAEGVAQPAQIWKDQAPKQRADHSRMGDEETRDLLGKLTWRPFDGTEITAKYSWNKGEDGHWPSLPTLELNCYLPTDPAQPWFETSGGAYCGKFQITPDLFNEVNLPDFEGGTLITETEIPPATPGTFREQRRSLLDLRQAIGEWELVARASYNEEELSANFDLDHLGFRAFTRPILLPGLFNFASQDDIRDYAYEVRVASPASSAVRGQLGVYYYDFKLKERQRSLPGAAWLDPALAQYSDWQIATTENRAVFGTVEWDFAPGWTFTLEGRYAEDQKSQDSPNGVAAEAEFTNFTPRITLRWQPYDDLSLYVLGAKGNKPGDFNEEYFRSDVNPDATREALANGDALVAEEESWNYEVGAKATWLDGRLTTNLAAFYIDWTNQGVFSTVEIPLLIGGNLITTAIRNAGSSRSIGLEFESSLLVNDALTLIANYGYIDAEFREYVDEFYGETTGTDGDVSGFTIPNSPKHNAVLGAIVTRPVATSLEAFLRADVAYESRRYVQAANFGWLGSRTLVNLRFGVESPSWTLTAYVRNLLDDDTPTAALNFVNFRDPPLANGLDAQMWSLNPPRLRDWGVEFQYRFGGE